MTFELTTPDAVRDYLKLSEHGIDADDLRFGDPQLGSNIRAASSFLQRVTRRQLEPQAATTKRFTTDGRAIVPILDLRSATSVALQGVALEADATFWLLPDRVAPDMFTAVQVRPWGSGGNYRSNPEWFDRNLDRDYRRGWAPSSLPNDLEIAGEWGYDPYPADMMMAGMVLAAWYTRRPDASLANVAATPDGTLLNYAAMPPEVVDFIQTWQLREQAVSGGVG